jgi:hypothetical protein
VSEPVRRGLYAVLALSLLARLAVIPLSIRRVNPYAQADAVTFANAAADGAGRLAAGTLPPFAVTDVVSVWGAFLAPLWLLPGPSLWYAHLLTALLGLGGVYNVYLLTAEFGSRRAGVLAAAVLGLLPSVVLVHGSLLREGAVLFGLTTILRVWLAPPPGLSRRRQAAVTVPLLGLVFLLRIENLPLYLLVAATFVFVSLRRHMRGAVWRGLVVLGAAASVMGSAFALPRVADRLSYIRTRRARGDSIYLPELVPDSALDLLAFSWVGTAYFLFAPFPWMVSEFSEVVVMWEGLLNLGFLLVGLQGVRRTLRADNHPAIMALLVGFLAGVVLYGAANANFGTAVRQRQMFLPVLYLFGSIGLLDYVELRWDDAPPAPGDDEDEVTGDSPGPRAEPR